MTRRVVTPERAAFAVATAALAEAADAVVRRHIAECRELALKAGKKERALAARAHGPAEAWRWFADPQVMALSAAVDAWRETLG